MTERHQPTDTPVSAAPAQPVPASPPVPQTYGETAPAGYQHQMVVAPKNPGLALFASFFFPGLGTLMNGQAGKGIAIFAGYFVSWLFALIIIGIPFLFGFWIWGMVDAYTGAKKWNARHGIIS